MIQKSILSMDCEAVLDGVCVCQSVINHESKLIASVWDRPITRMTGRLTTDHATSLHVVNC